MGDVNAAVKDLLNEAFVEAAKLGNGEDVLIQGMRNFGFTRQQYKLVDGRRGRVEIDLSDDIEKESKIIERRDFKNNHCVMIFLDMLGTIPAKDVSASRFYEEYFRYLRKSIETGLDFDESVQPYKNKVPLFHGLVWFSLSKRSLNASLLRNQLNLFFFVCACNIVHAELIPQNISAYSVVQQVGLFQLVGFFKDQKDDHPDPECDAKMLQQFGITPKLISKLRELSSNNKLTVEQAGFFGLMYEYFKPSTFPVEDNEE